ncbi:MAG: FAD-dependent oxidoreductase [Agarilytica sp.]
MKKSVAIIGTGISGLTAAYKLNRLCDITVFEKSDRIGGHTATVDFDLDGKSYAIDTGFIVFNDWTYPNFIRLLDEIGVQAQPTSMGFSVSCAESGLEYAGNGLNALFAQRANLVSPRFLGMLKDIIRFNYSAERDLLNGTIPKDMTLGAYLDEKGYGEVFARYYLVPMGAAIWSASLANMRNFPIQFFVSFFRNHGLLNIFNRPQWRVIKGGSKQYLGPLTEDFSERIETNAQIKTIKRHNRHVVIVFDDGAERVFDDVVLATHSDEALALLSDATSEEQEVLSAIPYEENSATLHYDESLLPHSKRTWSSWNYRMTGAADEARLPIVTYDMNILQGLDSTEGKTFCVSLNADEFINPEKVIGRYRYAHPQFTEAGAKAQSRWPEINGQRNTWYCGAYWANGFHEDGVVSGLRVAERFCASIND